MANAWGKLRRRVQNADDQGGYLRKGPSVRGGPRATGAGRPTRSPRQGRLPDVRGIRGVVLLFAIAGAAMMMGTGVAEPALHPILAPDLAGPDLSKVPIGYPTSALDQRIHRAEGMMAIFGAGGPTYGVEFREPSNPPLISFYDGYNVLSVNPESRSDTYEGVQISGNEIVYNGFYGPGADLAYIAAFNGIKEEIRVRDSTALENLGSLGVSVSFEDAQATAYFEDARLLGEQTVQGQVEVGADSDAPMIAFPNAAAIPSDVAERGRIPIPYTVRPYGSSLLIYLALPESMTALPDSAFPLVIDPSITPVDTTVTYSDETILQEEDLVVLDNGHLTLDTVDLQFNASYSVLVEDGGQLDLVGGSIDVVHEGDSWNASIYGDTSVTGTTLRHLNDRGYELYAGASGFFGGCWVEDSVTGIVIRAAPAAGTISGCHFDHDIIGIKIEGTFDLNNFPINGNWFQYGEIGIMVVGVDVTGSQMNGNSFEYMETGLMVTGLGQVSTKFSQFHNNYRGARFLGNANFGSTMDTDALTLNNFGVVSDSATITLTNLNMNNDNFDLYATASTVTINGPTTGWTILAYQVNLTRIHQVWVKVIDGAGDPINNITVRFFDSAEVLEASANTNSSGWATTNVTEYELHAGGDYAFRTPHTLQVGSTIGVHIVVDDKKTLTVYNSDDYDGDGRSNADEDMGRDVMWIDATARALNEETQIVTTYNTTSGKALQRDPTAPTDYTFITSYENPPLRPGTYSMAIRAKSGWAQATLGVDVYNESTGHLLADTFDLDPEFRFYFTASFTLDTYTKVHPQFTDLDHVPLGAIQIDKFAFIREIGPDDNLTSAQPGHVTDPLSSDTDFDLGSDGLEVQPYTYWFEAEMISTAGDVVTIADASNSRGLNHAGGSATVFRSSISGLPLPASPVVDTYFRMRCTQGSSCGANITVENNGTSQTVSYTIHAYWEWVNATWFTPAVPDFPINITVTDTSDPNLGDGTDYLAVDRLTFADTSDYPTPAFFRANPLDADLDRDGLFDGHEETEFFTKDKFQSETTPEYQGFEAKGDWLITAESTDSPYGAYADRYFARDFSVNEDGYWLAYSYAGFLEFCDQPPDGGIPANLSKVFNFTVYPAGNPGAPITKAFDSSTQEDSGGYVVQQGVPWNDWSIVSHTAYLLDVGNYTINVTLNLTYVAWLNSVMVHCQWGVRHDYLLTKKHVISNFVVDVDGDLVTDGYEYTHGSYPLSPDSDADLVDDYEELYAADDGRITNPLSSDTDGDGLSDYVEIVVNPSNATNPDTDGDHLPDGWTDGFHYDTFYQMYVVDDWPFRDGIRQPWEGEDLNGDGSISTSAFAYNDGTGQSTGGETNPNDMDTDDDSMPDSWELQWRGIKLPTGSPMMLNPIGSGGYTNASADQDGDGLSNFGEFNFDTDPYRPDSENDSVPDGSEVRIAYRTDIKQGAVNTAYYNESIGQQGTRWVYADANPYDGTAGRAYDYSATVTNATLFTINNNQPFESSTNVYSSTELWGGSANGVSSWAAYRLQKENNVFPNGDWYYRLDGNDTSTGNTYVYAKAYTLSVTVQSNTYLQWRSYVLQAPTSSGRISLEVKFTDGNYIRDMGVVDEFGNYLHPALHKNAIGVWEFNSYNISVAAGKTIESISVAYDDEGASDTAQGLFKAYVDDIRVIQMNESARAAWSSNAANRVVGTLRDGAVVLEGYNATGTRAVYVWNSDSDLVDANDDGILTGTFWRFLYNAGSSCGCVTNATQLGYRLKELHGILDPLSNDSDRDGTFDGWDGPRVGSSNDWAGDVDGDGWPNAADTDSDNDTLPDQYENTNGNQTWDPNLNETDSYDNDTDNDGVRDDLDSWRLDFDNDGLKGLSGWMLEEGSYGTKWNDSDTDDDGIADGAEDANDNAVFDNDGTETSALDVDTDDDGLWDGATILNTSAPSKKWEAEEATVVGSATVLNDAHASGGQKLNVSANSTSTLLIEVADAGLYQLNLTVGDAYNLTTGASKNPKNFTLNVTSPFWLTDLVKGTLEDGQSPSAATNSTLFSVNQVSGTAAYKVGAEYGVSPTGSYMFRLSGQDTGTGNSYAYYKMFDVNQLVGADTHLLWRSYVSEAPTALGQISIELKFTDGSYIRDEGIVDAYGNQLHPAGHVNRIGVWESFDYNISKVSGKTIDWIGVAYDDVGETSTATGAFTAYFDNIRVVAKDDVAGGMDAHWRTTQDLTSWPSGNWTNISNQWVVRLPFQSPSASKTASYLVTIGCNAIAGCAYNFYVDSINLTRILRPGEISAGTLPLVNDTDGDHVRDGTELAIVWAETLNQSSAQGLGYNGTNTSFVSDADNLSATSPIQPDTDADGLSDGWLHLYSWTNETDMFGEDYDVNGRVDNTNTTRKTNESKPWTTDSDRDGLGDGEEFWRTGRTDPGNWDTDNDGLPDGLEVGTTQCYDFPTTTCRVDLDTSNTTLPLDADTDNDAGTENAGRDGYDEDTNFNGRFDNGTDASDPLDNDTDDDGIVDGDESSCTGWVANSTGSPNTKKCLADTDGDGLRDGLEAFVCHGWTINTGKTGGCNPDSDGDGLNDGVEVAHGMNPLWTDSDNDGLPDNKEILWDQDSDGDRVINALDTDSDDDGLSDGYEEVTQDGIYDPGSADRGNMSNPDTDGDGTSDLLDRDAHGNEVAFIKDADNDGVTGFASLGFYYGGDERSNSACLSDINDTDTDGDGRPDGDESCTADYDNDGLKNRVDWDSDGDGLGDGEELEGWYLYFANGATRHVESDPSQYDTDGDGLSDGAERGDDTPGDPESIDTDGDHLCDKYIAADPCYEDQDSTQLDRDAPIIEDAKLSVKAKNDGFLGGFFDTFNMNTFWVRISAHVWDPSKVCLIVITFVDLAPAPAADVVDDPEAEQTPEQLQLAAQTMARAVEENESVARDIPEETGSCNGNRFKYGTDHAYQRTVFASPYSQFGGNVSAEFEIHDRGILKDGYRILVEAQDWVGNVQSVEKEGQIEQNWLERAWDTINVWEDAAAAIVRAFLAWLIEATGPIMGLVLGLIISIAKNIVDMIFGLPQMIDMMVFHFKDTVASFGQMFNNLGAVIDGMIGSMIDEAEQMLPSSWKVYTKPTGSSLLNEVITFLSNPFGYPGTNNRVLYDLAYIVGGIIGFVLMNFMGGGAAVAGKLKNLDTVTKITKKAKGIVSGTHAAGKATEIAKKVTSVVKNGVTKAKDGVLSLAKKAVAGLEDASSSMMKGIKKAMQKLGSKVPHRKSTIRSHNAAHAEGWDGGARIEYDLDSPGFHGGTCALTFAPLNACSISARRPHEADFVHDAGSINRRLMNDADFQATYAGRWNDMLPEHKIGAMGEAVVDDNMKRLGYQRVGGHHATGNGPDGWYVMKDGNGNIVEVRMVEVKTTTKHTTSFSSEIGSPDLGMGDAKLYNPGYTEGAVHNLPPDLQAALTNNPDLLKKEVVFVGAHDIAPSPGALSHISADIEINSIALGDGQLENMIDEMDQAFAQY